MISKNEFEGFNKRFDVVSCFLEHGGKMLMLHRQDWKPQGGTWSMPAGKVEKGDPDLASALSREMGEEIGLVVAPEAFDFFASYYVRHDGYDLAYHVFRLRVPERPHVEIGMEEHQAYSWMSPEEALALGERLMPDEDFCIKDCYNL